MIRRRKMPREVRDSVSDRVLAWCAAEPAGWLVAERSRLWSTAPEFDRPWTGVLAAAWSDPVLELTLARQVARWDGDAVAVVTVETVRCHLPQAGQLPLVVRERVMQSLIAQEALTDPPGGRLLARRDPDAARVHWQYLLPAAVPSRTGVQVEAAAEMRTDDAAAAVDSLRPMVVAALGRVRADLGA